MEIKINKKLGKKGLFATKMYLKDTTIFILNGQITKEPTRESIRICNDVHIIDPRGVYMNHSFEPSCKIEMTHIVAIRDIGVGDELNFNYNDSEVNMKCPFFIDGVEVSGTK
jgi:hypothetical protein